MFDIKDTSPPTFTLREPRVADKPFDHRAADVILRTSDKVDFYVYKAILSLASPVFESMLSLPQPPPRFDLSTRDGPAASHPVIDISEDSRTMEYVLHFCYPVRRPSMAELVDVGPVLLTAFKYDMNVVLSVAKIALEQCIDQDALGAFALALRCELYDVCSKAGKQFAQRAFLSLDSKELDHIKADRYRQLLTYHNCASRDSDFAIPPEAWSESLLSEEQPLVSTPASSTTQSFSPLVLSPGPPREADAPFDDKTADVILCSSDRTHFHVHNFILSLASPAFKDLIHDHCRTLTSEPEAHSAGGEGKLPPIINVTEDSRTLNFVLGVCYPVHLPRLTKLSEARAIFSAGLKYDITAVKSLVQATLADLVDQDALGVWCIALRCELRDLATLAARHSLQHPWASLNSAELSCISARQYHKLMRYHKHCGEVASGVTSSRNWFCELPGGPSRNGQCLNCDVQDRMGRDWYAPSSLWKFLGAAKEALEVRPCGLTVLSDEVLSQWTVAVCGLRSKSNRNYLEHGCARIYTKDQKFAQALAQEVDRVVGEIEVPSFF